ncbi:hypothetical protein PROFUN_13749 [Planoprotostelium fungivorum]|uniref:Uncharacterized protein n=1 Tax=Planoprotostelium fungivorum TaxID=1890364 RepID=A0A2P6N344_9EUKA|nr:hypothetical protein PROFUN_13749 [Planoprotostelium fungivorum]
MGKCGCNSNKDLRDKLTPLQFDASHHVSCLSRSVSLDNYPLFVGRDLRDISKTHYQGANKRDVILSCRDCHSLGRVPAHKRYTDKVERHMAYTLVPSIFSSGHWYQSKVRITLNNSVCTLNSSVIWTLLRLDIIFVTRVTYHWNQRISESQKQVGYQVIDDTSSRYKNTWATQKSYVRISGVISHLGRVPGLRALIFLTHITICIIFVNQDIYRWNQRSLLSQKQVERHMAYTLSKVRITLNNSLRRLNSSVIWTLLKLGIVSGGCQVSFLSSMGRCTDKGPRALTFLMHIIICIIFVNRDIYHWNQRSLLSQKQVRKVVVTWRALSGNNAHEVERHMAYTLVPSIFSSGHWYQSKVRITLNNSVCTLNSSVIWTLLRLDIIFVTRVTYHWNQRISESQKQNCSQSKHLVYVYSQFHDVKLPNRPPHFQKLLPHSSSWQLSINFCGCS